MFFSNFKKEVHNLKRLKQIAGVCVKYGFGYVIENLRLPLFISKAPSKKEISVLPLETRLRKVLEELGPTFIKLGQMLSLRPDIIPYSFCKEFEKLQDTVPPVEFEKIKEIIEQEFKRPLDEIFDNFPLESSASASLAQVYQVRLKNKEAIVKVQKPNVEETIKSDLRILEFLANVVERHIKEARLYNPKGILEEFKMYILKELDFDHEAVNIEKFRKNFKESRTVYFPAVYKELSNKKVLVMEKIKGIKISDIQKIEESKLDRKRIAEIISDCVLQQIFIDGFFHADPHPGNIFVSEDSRICFLDCAVVGRVDEETKVLLADLVLGAIDNDVQRIIEVFEKLGALDHVNEKKLKLALEELLDKYYGITLEEFNMNSFFRDIAKVVSEHKIKIIPEFFLLIKSLAMIESIGKMLDPGFNVTSKAKGFMSILIKEKYSAKRIVQKISIFARDTGNFLQNSPKDLATIFAKIKKGDLKLGFEHMNLENLISMLDKVSNRISFSLIISALIIGSSIIINTSRETIIGKSHHLGVIGFIVAGIMGFWLLITILRSGKL